MSNEIHLPLWETIKRSFIFIIKNPKDLCKICSIFSILWPLNMFCGQPLLCNTTQKACLTQIIPVSFSILMYLSCVVITVNTIRKIILKSEYKWFHLTIGLQHARYIAYNILLASMVIIPSALILMIVQSAQTEILSNESRAFLGAAFISTIIGLSILCCRLYLVYGGAAINDKEMTLTKSYMLTNGNMLKICIGQIILTLPTIFLASIGNNLYFSFTVAPVSQNLFSLWLILCYFIEASIKGSYYSHIYQYFEYMSRNTPLHA